jgi:hypothetical protein
MTWDPEVKSRFFDYLLAGNQPQMAGFKRWLFQPGMLFNAWETWWREQELRPSPHEGLDLCFFEDADGRVQKVNQRTRIPAAFAGEVIKISDDFLGKSIFLGHAIKAPDGRRLCTAYGHIRPLATLKVGQAVAAGEIMAVIAAPLGRGRTITPHLHLTLAWIPAAIAPERLAWPKLGRDPEITLLDPLEFLAPPG